MGHVKDKDSKLSQRVPAEHEAIEAPHLLRIAALEEELEGLRRLVRERAATDATVAQLREANQHLVLATVNAQTGRDDAVEAHRRQTEFLAMLAHELRNPLAPIGMAAALLGQSAVVASQHHKLSQVIGRQVEHMARLLDDLLDAARISNGKITLALQNVALADIIEQVVETVGPAIRERGQHLEVAMPEQPAVILGDRVRLVQVFTNLLVNASKYTREGGSIRIAASCADGHAVATVDDDGDGITPEFLPQIFELFTQGPRSLARSEGGLGVGLNVVRNLVGMHGGRVTATSDGMDRGSRFTVVLPLSDDAPAALPIRMPAAAGRGLRLLLVEDNVDACDTLQRFLALEGHEVHVAYDGESGLSAACTGDYDVLICDLGLPVIDGLQLVARLRDAVAGRRPYAVALSGYCQDDDRSRAVGAGFDDYCVKPVDPASLLALLASEPCQSRRAAAPEG
ncbi:hypothetical protein GCM10027321_05790 [Massilia terrae]|uniref:histidine kinase n=1 Tax=Massilia terrae TaxID=1811224 RepID=A0ABT2CSV4_9BURK|nr:hybrid sensor histidine kinase/response regulator [Massilia terrae]MCS0657061.1 hybrid sensor histidine kinase/response regulator [Massilia terrae]